MKTKILQNVRMLAIFLGFMAFAISCQDNATQTDINQKSLATQYQGVLTNESDEPIEGAVITAEDNTNVLCFDTTMIDGTFNLENLPIDKSNITLRIFHHNFQNFKIKLIDLINSKDFEKLIKIRLRNNDSCTGKMIFYVKDSTDGGPVVGANVKVSFGNIPIDIKKTNEDGKVVFERMCEGDYSLLIAKDGYHVIKDEFHLGYSDTLEKTYKFLRDDTIKCCASLKVIVRDNETKQALENVEVKLQGMRLNFIDVKKTNNDGIAYFENICEGKYWIRVAKEHYKVVEEDLNFEDCEAKVLELSLQKLEQNGDTCCDNKASITIKNEDGELINGAKVKLWRGDHLINTKASENGVVLFNELCSGKYGVSIIKEGYKPIEWNFTVTCKETLEFTKTLTKVPSDTCCHNKALITLKNENGELLNGATVKLLSGNNNVITKTTENGSVLFTELCSGRYSASASKDGYRPIEWAFVVICDQNVELTKTLHSVTSDSCCDNKVSFTINNTNNDLLNGATVKLWKDNVNIMTKTAENGTAHFEDLCSGKYMVKITKDGYKPMESDFTVTCHQTLQFTKTLAYEHNDQVDTCYNAIIKFKVRNGNEEPIAGATVIISGGGYYHNGVTNNEGYFVQEHLIAPANYSITISKDGYETLKFDWKLEHCETYTKAVILR